MTKSRQRSHFHMVSFSCVKWRNVSYAQKYKWKVSFFLLKKYFYSHFFHSLFVPMQDNILLFFKNSKSTKKISNWQLYIQKIHLSRDNAIKCFFQQTQTSQKCSFLMWPWSKLSWEKVWAFAQHYLPNVCLVKKRGKSVVRESEYQLGRTGTAEDNSWGGQAQLRITAGYEV